MSELGNGRPDWKWLVSLVIMGLGWAYTLGISREQLLTNTKDIAKHEHLQVHNGVRSITDPIASRVAALELRNAVINEKLDRILFIVEKNHGR